MVQFWFSLPEPFPNPEPIVNFNFDMTSTSTLILTSTRTMLPLAFLKISTCSSLYASWTIMILHRLLTLTDLLGYRCSGMFGFAPCIKQGADNEIDASDITFFNDPDDEVPLPQVPPSAQPSSSTTSTKDAFSILLKAGHTLATVTAGSQHSGWPSKPSARIRDADNACGLSSSSGTRKRALSSAMDHPAPKKVAVAMQILSPLDLEDEDIPSMPDLGESSADELIPQPEDNDEADEAKSKNGGTTLTLSKSECTADVRTIFTHLPDGWVCILCKDAGQPVQKHTFRGGTSTLHTHIVHHKKSHFQVYKERCDAAGITMHSCAIPPREDVTIMQMQMQMTLDGKLVCKPPAFTKEGLLEYIMELIVTEDEVRRFFMFIFI
ncbi:uncharacterized protein F5891DRAFT_980056 [Suillus fuscotomentosus]|uniref:Uncharacterized protein n=1 Tax=Suillus fuscotomentosus TaxID=1912939 RepID=A0AAD4E6W4_9AGAM|nr:uncharacterized protein F5891DRAFT_980056 [Suillus fuscotomentosus]KAG1900848.1 hypothetical protein F5891DRAFT_980056 [Suillus fuscotomentosus]